MLDLLGSLCGLLGLLPEARSRKRQQADAALGALRRAVRDTDLYLVQVCGRGRAHSTERRLCRLWGRAAQAIRRLDPTYALECLKHSRYWANQLRGLPWYVG